MRETRSLFAIYISTIITTSCGGVTKDTADVDAPGNDDTTPPTVVSISPLDAATQVMDEPVIIEFSEPMDRATVAAQFSGATSVVWNADGTRVEITIAFPFTATATPFTVTLPTTVTDEAGNGLAEELSSTFVLAELHATTILHDGALSGNRAVGCAAGTFVQAGDQASTDAGCPSTITFGGVSFPLATLPGHGTILALRSAFVRTQVVSVVGDPNTNLGNFVVDHVIMASRNDLIAPIFKSQAALTMFQAGTINVGSPLELDVATLLDKSWLDADVNFQLRFRPVNTSDADTNDDHFRLRRVGDENDGIVAVGLMEPDEANRMRLVIEFFQ